MNDNPNPAPPVGAPAPPVSAPAPSSGIDQAQYQAALEENRRLRDGLEALRPYADDISWIAENPEHAEFVRTSRQSYDEIRKRQSQGNIPDELKPLAADVAEIKGFVTEFRAAQQQAQGEPLRKWQADARTFCEGLMQKHPAELGRNVDPSLAWAGALERYCLSRGLTAEEGWKTLGPAFVKATPGTPPPSMRADTGMPGLPPPSRPPAADAGNPAGKKLSQIILERMATPS